MLHVHVHVQPAKLQSQSQMKNKPAFNGTQVQIKYHLAWEA
jgi:hypothetical protein